MKFESCADYSKYHLSYHVVNNIHVRPQKVTFWHLIWSGLSNLKWNSNFTQDARSCILLLNNLWNVLTTIAFEYSWWAPSSFTAILATLWESTFWRWDQSAFFQMFLGILLNPKPRRKAPVTNPKVFEHAIANPTIPPSLSRKFIPGQHSITDSFGRTMFSMDHSKSIIHSKWQQYCDGTIDYILLLLWIKSYYATLTFALNIMFELP